jgi:hypothetical protein
MIPMIAIGQAAGAAAALAALGHVAPRQLDVSLLQRNLIAQNAVLHL